ncbi:MAG: transcription termination/antitermination protein NusA [Anaerolinea sp.]|nr:transcription termination/antitermination protein NusA [Anaerolinea sp.]MCC6976139.1 transcription termination/antitermination protein NusA [Anaerolineae bacterium]
MAKSDFTLAFNEITETHHLNRDVVVEALRQALVSAYRRDSNCSPAQHIEAEVDPGTNQYLIFVEKEVVDSVLEGNDKTEVSLSEARKRHPNAAVGDLVMVPVETNTKTFGRIAAQTAKQVILQKIREAERQTLYDEYKEREGDLVTAQVQSINSQAITLTINGRAESVMPAKEQIRGERIRPHDKIRVLITEVKDGTRGPQIIVSRAHRNMLRRLLEYEVPEIYNGQVEIKSIAREPGQRSKVAVVALQPGIDPVGACVGMRGQRIQNIVKELNDEKIDVIEFNQDASVFIAKALSPARVTGVYLEDDIDQGNTATVIVPDEMLSLAIGREGQNARLAAKLTGWRIDIKSVTESAFAAYDMLLTSESLAKLNRDVEMVAEITRILEKKRADRVVMPEEYHTLTRFVQSAEQLLLEAREQNRVRRRKSLDKMRTHVPKHAFSMQLEELELSKDILSALKNRNITNAGELIMRLQAEPEHLRGMLQSAKVDEDAMDAIQAAVVSLVMEPETPNETASSTVEFAATSVTAVVDAPVIAPQGEGVPTDEETVPAAEVPVEDEEAPPAFVDEEPMPAAWARFTPQQPQAPRPAPAPKQQPQKLTLEDLARAASEFNQSEPAAASETSDSASREDKKGKKKAKPEKSREIIYDEDRGEMVVKRKRKGGRNRSEWEDLDEE